MNAPSYIKVASATPELKVADVEFNVGKIIELINAISADKVDIALFPELCITGYTCGDLFQQQLLLDSAASGLEKIWQAVKALERPLAVVVSLPRVSNGALYNSAVFLTSESKVYVDKSYIPNYGEFYEARWFAPAEQDIKIISYGGVDFAIEICEDLWGAVQPSSIAALGGAEIILNPSASDDVAGKYDYLKSLVTQQSARCLCGYVYASSGYGESSTDLVFAPKGFIAQNGELKAEVNRWKTSNGYVTAVIDIDALKHDRLHNTTFTASRRLASPMLDRITRVSTGGHFSPDCELPSYCKHPFVPSDQATMNERCTEIINIQVRGLATRLKAINCKKLVIGISGGLDSTLALMVAVKAFDFLGLDRKGIIGITMPGFGTTGRTHSNAVALMTGLGISIMEIDICNSVRQHFSDIGHDGVTPDVTYENSQARERTQILMDVANKENAIVLGTGDLSELALGWATYNGDHMSMYGVNASIPKTLVRHLVKWFADNSSNNIVSETLLDIVDTPISPELTPSDENGNIAQKTEDLVGPYELHDFFLYHLLRYGRRPREIYALACQSFEDSHSSEAILHWLKVFYRRFFNQQFKRSCMPDGPKVGSVCLSPRGDWRMPSDASSRDWLDDLSEL